MRPRAHARTGGEYSKGTSAGSNWTGGIGDAGKLNTPARARDASLPIGVDKMSELNASGFLGGY
jgi:hypothetical protein